MNTSNLPKLLKVAKSSAPKKQTKKQTKKKVVKMQGAQIKVSSSDISNIRKHYLNLIIEMKAYADIVAQKAKIKAAILFSTFIATISIVSYQGLFFLLPIPVFAYLLLRTALSKLTDDIQKKLKQNILSASYLLDVTLPSARSKSDAIFASDEVARNIKVPDISVSQKEFETAKKAVYDAELTNSNDIEILEEIKSISSKSS